MKFKKIYFSIAAFSCLSAICICLIFSMIARNNGKSLLISFGNDRLSWLSSVVDTLTETGSSLAVEIYDDKDLLPLLYKQKPTVNEMVTGMNRLKRYRQLTSFVHSIYIYNRDADCVYYTPGGRAGREDFFDNEVLKILDDRTVSYQGGVLLRGCLPRKRNTQAFIRFSVLTSSQRTEKGQ